MTATTLTASARAGRVHAVLEVEPDGDEQRFTLQLAVSASWHVYAPGADSGLPIEVRADAPMRLVQVEFPTGLREQVRGRIVITGTLVDARPGRTLRVRTQACDGPRCEPPAVARLTLESQTPPVADGVRPAGAASGLEHGQHAS